MKTTSKWTVAASILLLAESALAHHSVLPFDRETFSVLEGVISELRWRNPHVRLKVVVLNDVGMEEGWDLESGAANAIARKVLGRDDINVGDRIRVAGWPSKFDRLGLFVINLQLPTGQETVLMNGDFPLLWTEGSAVSDIGLADSNLERTIFRTWGIAELYKPREPFVFTAPAQAARAKWDPYTDMPAIKCIAPGMPNAILNLFPIEFIDEGSQIRLRIEEWEATRIIDMVSEEIPDAAPRSLLGYSIGRLDDGVLIIESSKVDFPLLDDDGTPMSEQATLVERFTVSEDGKRLDYEVSVTDPENLVGAATWDAAWKWIPGTKIMPFERELD